MSRSRKHQRFLARQSPRALGVTIATLGVALLAACADGVDWVAPDLPGPAIPLGGVSAHLSVGPLSNGHQTVWVSLEADGRVGAFQGQVTFVHSRIELASVEAIVPLGSADFGVVNEESPGVLRFAGYSVSGFDSASVVALTFKTSADLKEGDVGLSLEVVGSAQGDVVPDGLLNVSSNLRTISVQGVGGGSE